MEEREDEKGDMSVSKMSLCKDLKNEERMKEERHFYRIQTLPITTMRVRVRGRVCVCACACASANQILHAFCDEDVISRSLCLSFSLTGLCPLLPCCWGRRFLLLLLKIV